MQWYYVHTYGYKPPGIAMFCGLAAEHGLNKNFENKILTHEDLKIAEVAGYIEEYWDQNKDRVLIYPDDNPGEQKDIVIARTVSYRKSVAPKITPTHVQRKFEIVYKDKTIPKLSGVKDLEDATKVIDWKTVGKSLKEAKYEHTVQMSCYYLTRNVGTGLELHYINLADKAKDDPVNIITVTPDLQHLRSLMVRVYDGITKDVFIPNRTHYLCHPKFCGYYDECHAENK